MADEKQPSLDEQVQEAMKRVNLNGGIMGQATKALNMAYAFQFAQIAEPKVEVIDGQDLPTALARIHAQKGLIVSVCPDDAPCMYLVVYYAIKE